MVSIASTLGIGSGIDTKALVDGLVAAQLDPKMAALTAKSEALTAQISGVAQLKGGMIGFSNALAALVSGGSLSTQPTSSNAAALGVSLIAGAKLGTLSHEVEVRRLAVGQLATAAALPDQASPVGTGTMTITLGTASFAAGAMTGFTQRDGSTPITVTIAEGDNSLAGLAAAINAAKAGVTASIVADANGARLSLKGATGADAAFRIDVTEDVGAPGLAAFAFNPGSSGLSLGREALDSLIAVDGIEVSRAGNSVSDLIPGVKLDLLKAETGVAIALGSTRPTAGIGLAVSDFVGAFNELRTILKAETDPFTGALRGDNGARAMARQLGNLTSTALIQSGIPGAPRTLAEIGVSTNRDGTLSVDTAKLNAALAAWPDAIEAMFNPRQTSDSPLLAVTSAAGKTAAGSYAVTDIVMATAGKSTGAPRPDAFLTPIAIDATNKLFSIAIDGDAAVEIAIAEGDYADGAALAAALQVALDANSELEGRATFAWVGDTLVTTSATAGTDSAVTLGAVDATLNDRVGLTAATATAGGAGSGMIAGEPATVIGGFFFAAATSAAAGLILKPAGNVASAQISVDYGLGPALEAVARRLTDKDEGLSASEQRYIKQQAQVAIDQAKADADAEKLRERLTRQFATMDIRVAAYKATEDFLKQQVELWSADR